MSEKLLLVTGFEPFGGSEVNPAKNAVLSLPARVGELRISRAILPVVWGEAQDTLKRLIKRRMPDAVLSFGLAGGRSAVCLERVAINLAASSRADEKGIYQNGLIDTEGPSAYFANLPYVQMRNAIKRCGVKARYSDSAGTYLCNAVLYTALRQAALDGRGMKAGFIHLPYLEEQSDTAYTITQDQCESCALAAVRALEEILSQMDA